jgi:hypothetical protein
MTAAASNVGSFRSDVRRFQRVVETRSKAVFVRIAQELRRSIVEGSELTGAPGQPVDTGALKASWVGEFLTAWIWQLTTNIIYAWQIEHGLRYATRGNVSGSTLQRLTLRSSVGGWHSVALTLVGFPAIVSYALAQERGS